MNQVKDSHLFVCIRDLYENVDPSYCPQTEINDLLSEATDDGKPTEPINELFYKGKLQFAKSPW